MKATKQPRGQIKKYVDDFLSLIVEFESSFECKINKAYRKAIKENYQQYLAFLETLKPDETEQVIDYGHEYAELMLHTYKGGNPVNEIAQQFKLFDKPTDKPTDNPTKQPGALQKLYPGDVDMLNKAINTKLPNYTIRPNRKKGNPKLYWCENVQYEKHSLAREFINSFKNSSKQIDSEAMGSKTNAISEKEQPKGGRDYDFDINKTEKWFWELFEKGGIYKRNEQMPHFGNITTEIITRHEKDIESSGKPSEATIKYHRRQRHLMQYDFKKEGG